MQSKPSRSNASEAVVYAWESYPEYRATRQYSRCLGRVLASLPQRTSRREAKTLMRSALLIAKGIAGAHANLPPDQEIPLAERELYRQAGLTGIASSRAVLLAFRKRGRGSQPDIGAALELLERIEKGMRERPLPTG